MFKWTSITAKAARELADIERDIFATEKELLQLRTRLAYYDMRKDQLQATIAAATPAKPIRSVKQAVADLLPPKDRPRLTLSLKPWGGRP
jgi:cell division septum initiation protein DivIVA